MHLFTKQRVSQCISHLLHILIKSESARGVNICVCVALYLSACCCVSMCVWHSLCVACSLCVCVALTVYVAYTLCGCLSILCSPLCICGSLSNTNAYYDKQSPHEGRALHQQCEWSLMLSDVAVRLIQLHHHQLSHQLSGSQVVSVRNNNSAGNSWSNCHPSVTFITRHDVSKLQPWCCYFGG